jgi:FHS family L-fucose permease-like MFS transporter
MSKMSSSVPITERRYLLPFILVTSLFFLWAIGVNLNDILIPHLKKAFSLTDFRSSLVQSAFFGGYFLAALPAGWLMQRLGYKKGILIGLLICATGAFLFIPAASVRIYGFFLFALFVMACGQCFLEVAANPYVAILGPTESSERRLNFAQSFNSVGAVVTPFLGAAFILSGIEHTHAELSAMTPGQLLAYRTSEANMVKTPYLVITGIFLFVGLLIYFSSLPEVREGGGAQNATLPRLLSARLAKRLAPHLALSPLPRVLPRTCNSL